MHIIILEAVKGFCEQYISLYGSIRYSEISENNPWGNWEFGFDWHHADKQI